MSKSVGLSIKHKKLMEFLPFKERVNHVLFYAQAKDCYIVAELIFENGYITTKDFTFHSMFCTNQFLIMYHLAIELMLKALIIFKKGDLKEDLRHHDILELLKLVIKDYPEAQLIYDNSEYRLLIDELGKNFDGIRYLEGSISFRHNNKKGWKNKKPLEELNTAFRGVFKGLQKIFEKEVKV